MEETKFNKIMKEIKGDNLTSTQLENLFMALKEQPLALGGKFFTMDDAYEAILYEAPDKKRKDVIMEALVEFDTKNPAMHNALNDDIELEMETIHNAAVEAIAAAQDKLS